jgi:hypothetical protein
MRNVKKITTKKTVGYTYTTTDLVTFESNNEKGLVYISNIGGPEIITDLTEESTFMLMEFFRYLHSDLKAARDD